MSAARTPGDAGDRRRARRRSSVGVKVALVLIAVAVLTGCVAVGLTAWFSHARSLELAAGSIEVQLDRVAEEIEQRAPTPLVPDDLPPTLLRDLAYRFADPLVLLSPEGLPLLRIPPGGVPTAVAADEDLPLPPGLDEALLDGGIVTALSARGAPEGYGLAPLYDADGLLAGGVLVQPLGASLTRELADTRAAYRASLFAVLFFALLTAVLLAVLVTPRLVAPLRRITRRVEAIEAGDYAGRLALATDDEYGRLAAAVDRMAGAVEHSLEVLRATDGLRRELVANVGHDLRTPLAAMTGYLEEARRHLATPDTDRADRALAIAERQAGYVTRLVADLFELSVLDGPRPPLHRAPVPLAELLTDAARAHRGPLDAAGIEFRLDLAPDLPVLEADALRLLRLLDNLLVNARQHTPPGGRVELAAARTPGGVEVRVVDTGVGMDAETAAHIFERHYRGTDARTRRTEGTGLGLSIARAVARAHDGDLTVHTAPGEGTAFRLTLPHGGPDEAAA